MNRFFIALVVAIIFGFGLGIAFGPNLQAQKAQPTEVAAESEPPKDAPKNFLDADLADYYRLKSMEEKYRKADEILSKVILLFLSDLGLKMNPDQIANVKKSILNPEGAVAAAKAELPSDHGQPLPEPKAPAPTPVATTSKADEWKNHEKAAIGDLARGDYLAFLKKTEFSDPDATLTSSLKSFSNHNDSLQYIVGRFTGTAEVKRPKGRQTWHVETIFEATMGPKGPQGNESVKISRDGKVFSNKHGRGELRSFRDTEGSKAIILNVAPGMNFQLYYIQDRDQFIGNIYERGDDDQDPYEHIGTLTLSRDG